MLNAVAEYIIVLTVTQFCVTTAFPCAVVIPVVAQRVINVAPYFIVKDVMNYLLALIALIKLRMFGGVTRVSVPTAQIAVLMNTAGMNFASNVKVRSKYCI